ncbi:MAG TPA: cardiolipin synthase ClsB [Oxalicibacterium sp.]|nr:cardiolipin synthase ClsB [Oxalicibacterium sp.]
MKQQWISGNSFDLLENGEQFYPAVFEAIAAAQKEILLETFILYDDKVGRALQSELIAAAQRGVQVDMTIDGWGSPGLSKEFLSALTSAGVRVHVFDPMPGFLRRINLFRRLHRKLVVIDGATAFVGGINFSADHLLDFGPEAKQDYSVRVRGPIVAEIHAFALRAVKGKAFNWRGTRRGERRPPSLPTAGDADAIFVWRDNHRHTRDIERQYRVAIRLAKERVMIANAYFFPGYAFLRDLRKAARRGVKVSLILQGNPDMAIVQIAAGMLYHHLLSAGVEIYEYCDRPLHGKVAAVDDEWATVGSSNLDPLSLSLNLEANVVIRDRAFNARLSETLQRLMQESCKKIDIRDLKEAGWWRVLRGYLLFHLLRRYPAWLGWLPAHAPKIESIAENEAGVEKVSEGKGERLVHE